MTLCLRGICSLDTEAARRIAADYGFERVYPDLAALVADPEVDAVAVIVGPGPLASVIEPLLAKNVPILTEKPPGPTSEVTERLAQRTTVPHIVAFNRRFAPMNVRFKQRAGAVAKPFFVEGRFYRHNRVEAGFVRETGIHLLNLMTFCFGPVARLHARALPHPSAPTSNWIAELEFASGLAGRIQIFPSSGRHSEEIELHSETETLTLRAAEPRVPIGRVRVTRAPSPPKPGAPAAATKPNVTELFEDAPGTPSLLSCGFVAEYEELLALARGAGTSRSTFASSVETMRLAEAIERGGEYLRSFSQS